MYTSNDFANGMKQISIKEFKWKKEIMGFSWNKETNEKAEHIVIGYRGYVGSYYSYTPTVSIRFDAVEGILTSVYKKEGIRNTAGSVTIHKSLVDVEGVDYSVFDTEMNDESSFEKVAVEIRKMIDKGALPFFEKYQTIQDVFEATEKMQIQEMVHFIAQPLPQRRMIIKKLSNDNNYREYVDWLIDYYKSEKDEDWKIIEELDKYMEDISG